MRKFIKACHWPYIVYSVTSHLFEIKVNIVLPYATSSPSGLLHSCFLFEFCVHFSFPYVLHVVLISSSSLPWPNNVQ